ncbi:glycosyltransferase family 4 protein [Candidatus Wolfebacteria bacterium]|nr:glycosyltransferase family 4 protein [Candidatus Wolfebacteria bacterium]
MKILFLASDLSAIGGIQQYNRNLASSIKEAGEKILLLELIGSGLIYKIKFITDFFVKIIFWRPNIIICSHINFSVLCFFAKKILGIDYILNLYGIDAFELGFLRRRVVLAAKKIIILFEWTKNNILKQVPEIQNKIVSLISAVDENKFFIKEKSDKLMKRFDLSGYKTICTMSRISREEENLDNKGYKRVIKAMPFIIRKIHRVKYLLIGGGDYLDETKKIVEESGLENSVIFSGAIEDDDRIDYYNLCDVFVLPSKGEGCPAIVLLETLACGKPVITGNRECRAEDFLNEELGIMINPDNIEEIASAIIKVLNGNYPKLLYGEKLRKKSLEIYGLVKFKEKVKLLLSELKN